VTALVVHTTRSCRLHPDAEKLVLGGTKAWTVTEQFVVRFAIKNHSSEDVQVCECVSRARQNQFELLTKGLVSDEDQSVEQGPEPGDEPDEDVQPDQNEDDPESAESVDSEEPVGKPKKRSAKKKAESKPSDDDD
jgi:hypothetical protein